MNKRCVKCGEVKDEECFNWKRKADNLRFCYCKDCRKIVRAEWYQKHKESHKQTVTKRMKKLRKWFQDYKKTLKCNRCPESFHACLDFHHEEPNEKEICLSIAVQYGWRKERIIQEIEKCEVVCANCHRKIHAPMV